MQLPISYYLDERKSFFLFISNHNKLNIKPIYNIAFLFYNDVVVLYTIEQKNSFLFLFGGLQALIVCCCSFLFCFFRNLIIEVIESNPTQFFFFFVASILDCFCFVVHYLYIHELLIIKVILIYIICCYRKHFI